MQTISNQAFIEQIQLIDSLLSDQDSVIEELDRLNGSIESLIDKLADERKAEGELEENSESPIIPKIAGGSAIQIAAAPQSHA